MTDFAVGLDAGGSKTLLVAQGADGSDRIELQGPPANPQRAGLDETAEILAALVREALRAHRPVSTLAICAGVAGAGRPDEQDRLSQCLRSALADEGSAVYVQVVHDAHIALDAAFGAGSGLVVITGTGSVAVARAADGTMERAGGWGYLLGDPGSGYTIGQAGLQSVAEAFDGGADTDLRKRVREHYDIREREELIQEVYRNELSIQSVAPLVIEAAADGDPVASRILAAQTDELATHVEWLLNRCENVTPRAALLGGLLRNEHYAQVLRQALRDQLPNWTIETRQHEPVVGALRRARRMIK